MSFFHQLFRTKPNSGGIEGHGHLARTVGLFSLTMLGIGSTIGTGIFFTLAEAVPEAGPAVLLSFLLAGLTAALTAVCYAELSSNVHASGSAYSFAYATVGELPAYLVGACLILEWGLAGSAVAIGWSDYLNNLLQNTVGFEIPETLRSPMLVNGESGAELHAGRINLPPMILVMLCCVVLLRGAKESATINAIMVVIKLAVLAFFIAIALGGFNSNHFAPFFAEKGMKGVSAAAGMVFFSFIGLDAVATAGAEAKNPHRSVPLGILLALTVVISVYLLVALAGVGAQEAAEFKGQKAGLAVILQNVSGKTWPAIVLSAGAVISVFSVTLISIYGQTRILYAVAHDGLIPATFSSINPRRHTPVKNTVIVAVVVALIAGFVDASYLWDMVSIGTLVAFAVVSIAVPVLRAKGMSDPNGFQVPFGPYVIPTLSVFACVYIIKDLPGITFRVFGIWMAFALVGYFLYGRRNSRLKGAETTQS